MSTVKAGTVKVGDNKLSKDVISTNEDYIMLTFASEDYVNCVGMYLYVRYNPEENSLVFITDKDKISEANYITKLLVFDTLNGDTVGSIGVYSFETIPFVVPVEYHVEYQTDDTAMSVARAIEQHPDLDKYISFLLNERSNMTKLIEFEHRVK